MTSVEYQLLKIETSRYQLVLVLYLIFINILIQDQYKHKNQIYYYIFLIWALIVIYNMYTYMTSLRIHQYLYMRFNK